MSMQAPVRKHDPYTSRLAAERATPSVPYSRDRVLTTLEEAGPDGMTHEQIISTHRTREAIDGWPPVSQSRVRTACNELVKAGLVEAVPDAVGRSRAGNKSLFWRVASVHQNRTVGR